MNRRILLVDDDESFRQVVEYHLKESGYATETAQDGREALALFIRSPFPVVVTDLKMPVMDGLELLKRVKDKSPETVVIVITAFGDIDTAVKAMKAGAYDFIPKPTDREYLKLAVKKAFEHYELETKVKDLEARLGSSEKEIIFASPEMERTLSLADRVAGSDATVLILGESGTGKELIARRIHKQSGRKDKPFVVVNCAAIPRELLESELFGHIRGAFTGAIKDRRGKFQLAEGGTIFLDEVGELPLELQPRLLRVLQEKTVDIVGGEEPLAIDVRVIAATNRDLAKEAKEGRFREDLYFRLSIFPIIVPPLRERVLDIPILASHFLNKYSSGKNFIITPRFLKALEGHGWSGNVRELENVCQRVALFASNDVLDESILSELIASAPETTASPSARPEITLPKEGASLEELEKQIIIKALEMNGYNQSRAARFLKIPRHILLYRMGKFGIKKG
ncbi:MAG: sigma-54 dependent transcriptional regulator [Myxococcota bacterium]